MLHPTLFAPPRALLRRLVAVVCFLSSAGGFVLFAQGDAKRNFDVPAGAAETALKLFSEQSGRGLLISTETARDVRTNPVKGEFTAREALDRMLADTGLVASQDPKNGAFVVRRAPSPNAPSPAKARTSSDAQVSVTTKDPGTDEKPVMLTPFEVTASSSANRYSPADAISGGRVRIDIFSSSQNVSVLTSEFVSDVAASRVLDGMKFVAGVSESSLPNGLDRITIRGFLTTLRTLDGVTSTSQANIDPFLVERLEIVKGPNAVLAPAGVPGGTINNVSKKPVFRDYGSMAVEVGRFDSQRIEFDISRVVARDVLAVRLLAATQDGKDYWGMPKNSFLVAPMFSYRPSPRTQLTWQTHFINWKIGNYDGIPIDPSAGTANTAVLYRSVPRNLNIYGLDSYRWDDRIENTLLFTGRLTDSLSLRVLGRHGNQFNENNAGTTPAGASTSAGTNANSFDPLTGNYTPGIVYATTPPYATTPVTITRTYNRSGSFTDQSSLRYTFQADLVHEYSAKDWKAESLLGYAYTNDRGHDFRWAETAPAFTLENFVFSPDVVGAVSRRQMFHNISKQVFVNERISLFSERVIVNGGYSRNWWDLTVDDKLATLLRVKPSTGLATYGAVFKPVPKAALFYSHAQNAAPLPVANVAAGGPPLQTGVQDEVGMRLHLNDNRLRLMVSYYNIQQNNTNVPNPANFAFPPPVPTLPGLLANRTAKGWEFEAQGTLTKELSVVAAYTTYKNRNPFGQEFRGAAEKAGSVLVRYAFAADSALHGLATTVSADYLSRRAGDDASGFTVTGIPRKPTFYLPARTLVNLGLGYRFNKEWHTQVNVDNLFNTEYLTSSLSRGIVWPGTPTNVRCKVTFQF